VRAGFRIDDWSLQRGGELYTVAVQGSYSRILEARGEGCSTTWTIELVHQGDWGEETEGSERIARTISTSSLYSNQNVEGGGKLKLLGGVPRLGEGNTPSKKGYRKGKELSSTPKTSWAPTSKVNCEHTRGRSIVGGRSVELKESEKEI